MFILLGLYKLFSCYNQRTRRALEKSISLYFYRLIVEEEFYFACNVKYSTNTQFKLSSSRGEEIKLQPFNSPVSCSSQASFSFFLLFYGYNFVFCYWVCLLAIWLFWDLLNECKFVFWVDLLELRSGFWCRICLCCYL